MRTEDLTKLLTSMDRAADVVESLDDPALRKRRGWRLAGWSYELVPWGVRFLRRDARHGATAAVVAVALPEAYRTAVAAAYIAAAWPTTLLLLG